MEEHRAGHLEGRKLSREDLMKELAQLANNDQAEETFRMLARNAMVYQRELITQGATPQLADQLVFQMNEIYLRCFFVRGFSYPVEEEE